MLFVVLAATIIFFVARQITLITIDPRMDMLILAIAMVNIVAMTWATWEVFLHIRRNAKEIYSDDISYLDLMAEQRRARS